jgi:hypothetical protein
MAKSYIYSKPLVRLSQTLEGSGGEPAFPTLSLMKLDFDNSIEWLSRLMSDSPQ